MASSSGLVVVADERAARFFLADARRKRLKELQDLAESADFLEHHDQCSSSLRVVGGRTMVKSREQCMGEDLQRYLRRVAAQIDRAMLDFGCSSLALYCQPHVLNLVRDFIRHETRVFLCREICGSFVAADLAQIERLFNAPDMPATRRRPVDAGPLSS